MSRLAFRDEDRNACSPDQKVDRGPEYVIFRTVEAGDARDDQGAPALGGKTCDGVRNRTADDQNLRDKLRVVQVLASKVMQACSGRIGQPLFPCDNMR